MAKPTLEVPIYHLDAEYGRVRFGNPDAGAAKPACPQFPGRAVSSVYRLRVIPNSNVVRGDSSNKVLLKQSA